MTKVLVDKAVLEQAIAAIQVQHYSNCVVKLREALAAQAVEPEQKPVVWLIDWPNEPELGHYFAESPSITCRSTPLYTHPAPAAKPLSDEQRLAITAKLMQKDYADGDAWDAALIDAVISEFCRINGIKEQS